MKLGKQGVQNICSKVHSFLQVEHAFYFHSVEYRHSNNLLQWPIWNPLLAVWWDYCDLLKWYLGFDIFTFSHGPKGTKDELIISRYIIIDQDTQRWRKEFVGNERGCCEGPAVKLVGNDRSHLLEIIPFSSSPHPTHRRDNYQVSSAKPKVGTSDCHATDHIHNTNINENSQH